MPNLKKRSYVESLSHKLKENPQFVIVGFGNTTHKRLEEFRAKLRAESDGAQLIILKNSLFKVTLAQLNAENKLGTPEDVDSMTGEVRGQSALLFLSPDWISTLKVFKAFSKEEEGMQFKAGYIDNVLYMQAGLQQLADLPSTEEIAVKLISALKAPSSRLVYSLSYNMMRLTTVLKNAAEKAAS